MGRSLFIWVIMAAFIVIYTTSFTRMQDLKKINQDYQSQISQLKKENARLKKEKKLLEEDPAYLERIAREKMGLTREGEVVYHLTPER